MTPRAHMSHFAVYCSVSNASSSEKYEGEPHNVLAHLVLHNSLAWPRSPTRTPLAVRKIFALLTSRWRMWRACKYSKPEVMLPKVCQTVRSESLSVLRFKKTLRSPSSHYSSKMRNRPLSNLNVSSFLRNYPSHSAWMFSSVNQLEEYYWTLLRMQYLGF